MGSFPTPANRISSHLLETSCGYLLQELKIIWDEVGQDQLEREKVLFELEEECLEAYRRKVDNANISRARLHQALADSEAEFTHLLVTLGERSLPKRPEKMVGTLKEQLDSITPALREMQLRKEERVKQFQHVQMQIQKITSEIVGPAELDSSEVIINENDLSLKKLEEYQNELQRLQKEKSDRLLQVEVYIAAIYNLSATLGKDSSEIITKVHPSLDGSQGKQSKNISDDILTRLNSTMESLQEEKQKRLEKLERLGKELTNLWSLMDTPYEDRRLYSHLTDVISTSVAEISKPGSLAIEIILQAEAEVQRLDQLKASKMQELFLKKQRELEEICKKTHMEMPSPSEMDNIMDLIKSGKIDHADLLTTMDEQISRARAEASSRNGIMEKVEKWIQLRDEEHWLDEYNMDENRYSVSRGAHKNLRRAERARITVNKLPALMDSLMEKTRSWEEEHEKTFLYDEVPLLAMLEEYAVSKREKEEEKQRQREKKKVQVQGVVEQDRYSSRPSTSSSRPSTSSHRLPSKTINGGFGNATPFNRRLSMGIQQLGSNSTSSPSQAISSMKETKKSRLRKSFLQHGHTFNITEDTASVVSATYS